MIYSLVTKRTCTWMVLEHVDTPCWPQVGYNQIVYEPRFALSADKTSYNYVSGTRRSLLPRPMPISMMLWSGPGEEPVLIKIASAYEAATKHRVPPPDFGPLPEG